MNVQSHDSRTAPRLTNATTDLLARLSEGGLLERGCVVLIGLDAIRDRLGAQWASKRETVWDAAERVLTRRMGEGGLWARVGDVDYVVSGGEHAGACRAAALKVLRELLEFFLGEQRFEDMRIAVVFSLADGEIGCRPLDPQAIEREGRADGAPDEPGPKATTASAAWSALTVSTGQGQVLALSFDCEQIVNLRNDCPIATRLSPVLTDTVTGHRMSERWSDHLGPASVAAINAATIDYARTLYQGAAMGILVSFSINALSSRRLRADLAQQLDRLGRDPTKPLLLEILDIDEGTPQGRILEVVSALAPHCRKLFARAPLHRPPLDLLRGCRLAGLSVDCAHAPENNIAFLSLMQGFCVRAKTVAPLVVALNLTGETARNLAGAAGATHGGQLIPTTH